MDSQTKTVKFRGHEIFKEHHKDNKNREKRPETMRSWEFIQILMRMWPWLRYDHLGKGRRKSRHKRYAGEIEMYIVLPQNW